VSAKKQSAQPKGGEGSAEKQGEEWNQGGANEAPLEPECATNHASQYNRVVAGWTQRTLLGVD
jgi:hypothetical protein